MKENRMHPDLETLLADFLAEHREGDGGGGWAEITPDDVDKLRGILNLLIELKCDKDADGDYPIEARLINRRVNERLSYWALPYREQGGEVVLFEDMMRIALLNLRRATREMDGVIEENKFF